MSFLYKTQAARASNPPNPIKMLEEYIRAFLDAAIRWVAIESRVCKAALVSRLSLWYHSE